MGVIHRDGLDSYLNTCMERYGDSLIMRFANENAQDRLRVFMEENFLPAWKREILSRMEEDGRDSLSEDVLLEEIHARLYLSGGFAAQEQKIFRELDPEGYNRFLRESTREVFREGKLSP